MLEIIEPMSLRVVAIRISGPIGDAELTKIRSEISSKHALSQSLAFYVEFASGGHLNLKEVVSDLGLIPLFSHFRKVALISDSSWLARITDISGLLGEKNHVRHFSFAEADSAMDWIHFLPPKSR